MIKNEYQALSDNDLLERISNGDKNAEDTLVYRYMPYVSATVRPYFLIGAEKKDLIQEGLIGVALAIKTYNGKSTFKNYASICIKNRILNAIKKYNSNKFKAMYNYVSLYGTNDVNDDKNDYILDKSETPEEILVNKEKTNYLISDIKRILSDLEYKIFDLYIQGYTYVDIAKKLNKNEKAIDNALQRIRKKASQLQHK